MALPLFLSQLVAAAVAIPVDQDVPITITQTAFPTQVATLFLSSFDEFTTTISGTFTTSSVASGTSHSDAGSSISPSNSKTTSIVSLSVAVPASVTAANGSAFLTLETSGSDSSISNAGIISLSVILVVIFLALIALLWRYRRQKKSYAAAMLIAPRLSSQQTSPRPFDLPDVKSYVLGRQAESDLSRADSQGAAVYRGTPVVTALHPLRGNYSLTNKYSLSSYDETKGSEGFAGTPMLPDAWNPMANAASSNTHAYPLPYASEGMLSRDCKRNEDTPSVNGDLSPEWYEALGRLNSLRQGLVPPPLRIVKRSASNPENRCQTPVKSLKGLAYPDIQSLAEIDLSMDADERESIRSTTLAKLDGDLIPRPYTPSVYSRHADGETVYDTHEDREAWRQWGKLEKLVFPN